MATVTEEEGVKAIVELQKLVGIDEPEEKARKNWRKMSEQEKEDTMWAYLYFVVRPASPEMEDVPKN